jgi:hypothetical protein
MNRMGGSEQENTTPVNSLVGVSCSFLQILFIPVLLLVAPGRRQRSVSPRNT